jgi:hypothetical protein
MDDWKVMLLVFSGFVAVVAVCVGLITAQIVGTHVARRPRADNERAPLRSKSRQRLSMRSVAFALLMLLPVLVVGAAGVLAVKHLAR